MFGLGWTEILLIAVIAVLVVPPKDLPGMMRNVGRSVGKLRRMASQFQRELENAVRDDELDNLRKQVTEMGRETRRELGDIAAQYRRPAVQRNASVTKADVEAPPAMAPLPAPEPAADTKSSADAPASESAAAAPAKS
jgi:sec-independent protein translocase protein TatB